MIRTLEITQKNQWASIKGGLRILILIPLGLILGHITGKLTWNDYPDILVVIGLFYLLLFLPAIFIHTVYYVNNRGLKIVIDTNKKTFSFTKDKRTSEYNYSDIAYTEKNLNIYNKNKTDDAVRLITPWSGYNYIKFRLKDGKVFFVTSLMTNILDFDFECNETHYSLFTPLVEREWQTIDYSDYNRKE